MSAPLHLILQLKHMNIPERKLDYLFNQNIASDPHNTPRASENLQQMQRLGLHNIR